MIKNIRKRLGDYFFARDIYQSHIRYENKVREAISNDTQLHYVLDGHKPLRVIDVLGSSAIPNLLQCAGMGLSIYHNDLSFAVVSGLVGEAFRVGCRRSAKKRLEFHNKLMDFPIKMQDFADRTCDAIQQISDKLDNEGEEWKRQ